MITIKRVDGEYQAEVNGQVVKSPHASILERQLKTMLPGETIVYAERQPRLGWPARSLPDPG